MDGKFKALTIGLVLILIVFAGFIVQNNHDQKSVNDPCINKVSYLDGSMGHDYSTDSAVLTVEFSYDFDKVYHQSIKLTGGPAVHILYNGQYIGKLNPEQRSITLSIDNVQRSYSIHYDLSVLGITPASPGWFVYNGQYIPLKDLTIDAESTIPQSWEKWMVDGYTIETRF